MTIAPCRLGQQNRIGASGEARLDAFLSKWFYVMPVPQGLQDQGIDRILCSRTDWAYSSLEIKTDDKAHRTGNAFVELIGDNVRQHQGWAVKSKAQFLAYLLAETGVCYIVRMNRLREQLERWEAVHPTAYCSNIGRLGPYQSEGILVPLAEIQKIAERVYQL